MRLNRHCVAGQEAQKRAQESLLVTVQLSCSRDSSIVEMTVPWEDPRSAAVESGAAGLWETMCPHGAKGRAREVTQDPERSPDTGY